MTKQILLAAGLLMLTACDTGKPEAAAEAQAQQPVAAPVGVIAEVNGEVITQLELEQMALDMFGEYQANAMEPAARQKLLDSMVSSLALAQKAVAALPAAERARIENKTRRYRENLLISEYISSEMTPQPITESMIAEYYNKNRARFGETSLRKYQLITTRQPLALDQRNAFLKKFAELKTAGSLQTMHQQFLNSGFATNYQTGVAEPGLLSHKLLQVINNQNPGELSDVHYIDDVPYLVLVDEILQQQAKPLSQVRSGIRKTLAMAQLKQAVKTLSETARQAASVTIH